MWIVLLRLQEEGKEGVDLGQSVYEIYNHNVEVRVSKAGVRARIGFAMLQFRNKSLRFLNKLDGVNLC